MRLRALITALPGAVAVIDAAGAMVEHMGGDPELLSRLRRAAPTLALIHAETVAAGTAVRDIILVDDGGPRILELRAATIGPAASPPSQVIANIRDVTDARRNDAELRAAASRRARLWETALSALEEERRRIARELHDHAGASLAAMLVTCGLLERDGPDRDPSAAAARLVDQLTMTLDELARLARGLHPVALDELGLAPTLERSAATLARAGSLAVKVSVDLGPERLPPAIELALYRIAQEGMTNVTRHARAHTLELRCKRIDDQVTLTVIDDGCGFDLEDIASDRLGLVGLRDRVTLMGGVASIRSAPGQGTTVEVRLPLDASESDTAVHRRTDWP